MNKIGFNIRKVRESKGFSQDYMANVLDISQASYARLENEDTKVTVDRLYRIAEVLETNIIDFFDTDRVTIQNQNNYEGSYGLVQNLTVENKEIYEKLLQTKEEQINMLTKIIEKHLSL
ncbi:MAG TPA: helix-turn-helix transcriptional regulator [Flavobacterium sp.]|nr:helix-turn-helix transcriptional regulator [Flavobacterium sp.]